MVLCEAVAAAVRGSISSRWPDETESWLSLQSIPLAPHGVPVIDIREHIQSCLLGGAVGDAWGGPYEGLAACSSRTFPAVGSLSDDTLLTAATCEAIVEGRGRVRPDLVAARLCAWFDDGRLRGLGSSTLKALRDLSAGAHWALAGARGEFAAGSGSAMRAAPLAFVLDPAASTDRQTIRDISRITHHSDEAYAGALAMIAAIQIVAQRRSVPPDLLHQVQELLPDTAVSTYD